MVNVCLSVKVHMLECLLYSNVEICAVRDDDLALLVSSRDILQLSAFDLVLSASRG